MSSSDSIEVTASTIDEAINQALARLGAEQDDVAIEVLSAPRAGVLGLGARPARVRVTRHAMVAARSGVISPPPAPPLKPRPPQTVQRQAPPQPAPQPRVTSPPPGTERPAVAETTIAVAAGPPRATEAPVAREPRRDDRREPQRRREPARQGERQPRPSDPRATSNRDPDDREAAQPGELDYEREPDLTAAAIAAAAAAGLREQARAGREILAELLRLMGEQAQIELAESDDPDMLELNIRGDGSGILIGRHGQTLDAIEYLVNRMLARRIKDAAPISVDTESYRARRRRQLQRMALAMGEQAKREHVAVTLEPMPPRDRRIVHLALKDDPMIMTRSSGDGFIRAVEIAPVDGRRGEPAGGARRERERRSEREQEPLGQQGGFKHGQKRIV